MYKGVTHLIESVELGNNSSIKFYKLQSTNLIRKFIGIFDVFFTFLAQVLSNNALYFNAIFSSLSSSLSSSSAYYTSRQRTVSSNSNNSNNNGGVVVLLNLCSVHTVFVAMFMHRSQFVWFRVLFVLLSRFSYMNSFVDMKMKKT